jgi:hypothetical protein
MARASASGSPAGTNPIVSSSGKNSAIAADRRVTVGTPSAIA